MSVLDRSWYGRVLVERVEGLATVDQWSHAYDDIVAFERMLAREGAILVKFWLHISAEEQLRRFERRAEGSAQALEADRPTTGATASAARTTRRRSRTCSRAPTTSSGTGSSSRRSRSRYARVKVIETAIAQIERGMRERGFEPADVPAG